MKKFTNVLCLSLCFILLMGSFSFAADKKDSKLEDYNLRTIEASQVPAGITPIEVKDEAELIEVLDQIKSGEYTFGSTVEETTSLESESVIVPMSLDTKSVDLHAYVSNGLHSQNAYSTVTYNTAYNTIDSVSNLYSDITGYTVGVEYEHKSNFNNVSYSSDRKTATIKTGGHYTYYFLVDGVIKVSEENSVITYKYSVANGIHSISKSTF
ncbi:hypothetical protein [Thermotalea metallivorans]|uniref:Uncharacterized protein n=1 Tax=Thermotalea metallivorans TaxID=520762 RepID=A0A140L1S7_9FIRM|nr:hypothetical protein [Thermotalea metallivorans]KXG74502.1 hypothetical protein AN619_23230 [Thermotalea metallivorans]